MDLIFGALLKAKSFAGLDSETGSSDLLGSCAGLSVCCILIEPGSTSSRHLTKTLQLQGDDVALGMTAETSEVRNDRAETPAVTGSN
jgi:hypothetical protein